MTDEQINQQIAELCGWSVYLDNKPGYGVNHRDKHDEEEPLPNYCNDLNAMHEAEEFLTGLDCGSYSQKLADVDEAYYGVRATARQRAEAFLRTLGKWEEVQG